MALRSKISIVILFFFQYYNISKAQTPFINYDNGNFNSTSGTLESYKGNYILFGYTGIYNSTMQDAYVIKFNKHGLFIDSLRLTNLNKSIITCATELPNTNIAYFGNALLNDTLKMLCVITDENLTVLSIKTYTNLKYGHYPQTVRLKGDTIIVTGMYYDEVTTNNNPYVYKLNFNNDILETDYLQLIGDNWAWQSLEINNKIKLSYLSNNVNPNFGAKILTADLNFNSITDSYIITNKMPLPSEFVPNVYSDLKSYIKQLNDSIIIATSSFSGMLDKPPYTFIQHKIGVYKINCNQNDTVVKYLFLGKTDTVNNETNNTINFLNKENIYIGYNSGVNQYSVFPSSDFKTSYGCITKIDTNLNVVWQKYFGNDYHYSFYSLLACKDDGALLSGNYSDYYNHNGTRKIVAYKVDKLGNYINGVGIKKEISNTNKIQFFPNPAQDIITATFTENTYNEIGLLNNQGQTVFKQFLKANVALFKIDCSQYLTGSYTLYFKEKETGFGVAKKIVIQK